MQNATVAGHTLNEFIQLVGTVSRSRWIVFSIVSPDRRACPPKKYVLKMGGKMSWLTATFVAIERVLDAKLKLEDKKTNLAGVSEAT
jgi:hypothetical protein